MMVDVFRAKVIWLDYPSKPCVAMKTSSKNLRLLVLLAVLSSLCLAVQLMPRPPNVEFTSLFTFLAGVMWGIPVGMFFGGFVMFVNAFYSPWGYAGLNAPFQMFGMAIAGAAGGVYRRYAQRDSVVGWCYETAVIGASVTLVYDLVTNLGFALQLTLAGSDLAAAIFVALSAGAVLMVIHVASNIVVFGALSMPLLVALRKLVGGENA